MYRIHPLCALLITILLSTVTAGAQTVNECGTLVFGMACIIFVSDSQVKYNVSGDVSPFEVGDRVAITGTVDPNCLTICWEELCLIVDTVFLCDDCCISRVGDANGLGGEEPTIGDVSVMINAKFIAGTCDGIIDCLAEADINQSGGCNPICEDITIGDIATLIDYLFITVRGPLPHCLECP